MKSKHICRTLNTVVAKEAQAFDCTYACPKRMGEVSAAVTTNEKGEMMCMMPCTSEAYSQKREWLSQISKR
jgi:hypothetical protein